MERTGGVRQASSLDGLPLAEDADGERLTLTFDAPVPQFTDVDFVNRSRSYYHEHAVRILDALQRHAPQGLVDAIFGELAQRKASIYRVTGR